MNNLVGLAEIGGLKDKIYAIYSSPLKALSNDIHKNLIEPLEQIKELIKTERIDIAVHGGDLFHTVGRLEVDVFNITISINIK